jgi:CubicO group peptidase (beta-lactamase class C family)
MRLIALTLGAVTAALLTAAGPSAEEPPLSRQLIGLWHARRDFGPDVRGPLTLDRNGTAWTAEIAGRTAAVQADGDHLSFDLADNQGRFRGRLLADNIVRGHWLQPRMVQSGASFATPVTLAPQRPGRWRGAVAPLDDTMTFHLRVHAGDTHVAQGTKTLAFLRNPERNAARNLAIQDVMMESNGAVKLMGRRLPAIPAEAPATELVSGRYDSDSRTLSLYLPWAGGTFDFRRATSSAEAGFYPRGRVNLGYTYRPPLADDDGWPVGTLDEVAISRDAMSAFAKILIELPVDGTDAPDVHAVLIARHGKLVFEEYFHAFHRDEPHDTRSAAKSLTSTLVGAAILKGAKVRADTPVYAAMSGGTAPPGLDVRAQAITLEHLLMMSSGLDCDDADPASPGNEDKMQEQTEQPDWYRYTLDLKMLRPPGEKAVYCSVQPNLAGGVLARTTGQPLAELVDEHLARPLQFGRYALFLTPTGAAYMGGGARLRPRDFMKLAQVMLDGGKWRGKPLVSAEWAKTSTTALRDLRGEKYGYLWWITDYPYKGRTVRAFYAAGNGGQIAMAVPELDLVIAFLGGNYSQPNTQLAQKIFVPQFILPAVN